MIDRRLNEREILIATHNAGKLDEFRALLEPRGISVRGAAEFNLPEPAETGTTFLENAQLKARAAVSATGLPALADDSGLEVDALDGAPGVYTADWAETPTGRDFHLAMARVHQALDDLAVAAPHRAQFVCTLVLAWPDGHEVSFVGTTKGKIVAPMRGVAGHGYDPIFQPDGHSQTFGEMAADQKNAISHRARAVRKFEAILDA